MVCVWVLVQRPVRGSATAAPATHCCVARTDAGASPNQRDADIHIKMGITCNKGQHSKHSLQNHSIHDPTTKYDTISNVAEPSTPP